MKVGLNKNYNFIAVPAGILSVLLLAFSAFYYMYYILAPEKVNVSVRYSPGAVCGMDTPIYMLITNDSYRDIIKTSFTLIVKKESGSDNFIQLLEKNYSTDSPVKAGDTYGGCWVYPKLITSHYVPEELIYEIKNKNIVFRD
jgi:hypothetical protein